METAEFIALILFPLLIFILGSIGGLVTAREIPSWFEKLKKPSWNPPNWVFGPVWTILYLMIGMSGFLIWDMEMKFSSLHQMQWILYFSQLILNFSWSPIFFKFHMLFLALIVILLMDVFILLNIISFWQINKAAAVLLVPYFNWVLFASVLNFKIWDLNKNENQQNLNISYD